MRTTHYVLGVLAVLLLVGGAFAVFSFDERGEQRSGMQSNVAASQGDGSDSNSAASGNGTTHTVTLTGDGFEPETLTIQKGDTVEFSTKRDKPFWPASNLHPTHTINPEFDPNEPIQPDDTWSYTFTKKGEWGMHDHLAPYFTGKIIVE